jgi:hypothetical protein
MASLIGQPHYEIIGRYGMHETVLTRIPASSTVAEINEALNTTGNHYQYPVVVFQYRAF